MKSLDIEAEHSPQMKGMGGSYIILKYLLISYIQFSNSTRCQKNLAPGKNENIYTVTYSQSLSRRCHRHKVAHDIGEGLHSNKWPKGGSKHPTTGTQMLKDAL